jgi:dihydroorotate dehydrogenase
MLFRRSAQDAHEIMLRWLSTADSSRLTAVLGAVRRLTQRQQPLLVGGVRLNTPLILAAGFVKGTGFDSEEAALAAVECGENIIPGWRAMPRLAGAVEFGSFTRYPRLGNPGVVVWRDVATRSTQNRVGLKNTGVRAAAAFLHRHQSDLPATLGINVAVSPGVADPAQERDEVLESLAAFVDCGVKPAWFTLNLSCPNTDDDPTGNQTEGKARDLCGTAVDFLRPHGVPLWVKIGPNLSDTQYRTLIAALDGVGASAIVATNTLPEPSPDEPAVSAGVGGGRLHAQALRVCALLVREKRQHDYAIDVIGCGGVLDGESYQAFRSLGVQAVQYWSALVYRGPLAAAVIQNEIG